MTLDSRGGFVYSYTTTVTQKT